MAAGRSRKEPSLLTFVKATIIGGCVCLWPGTAMAPVTVPPMVSGCLPSFTGTTLKL